MESRLVIKFLAFLTLATTALRVTPSPTRASSLVWGGSDFAYYFTAFESYWRGLIAEPFSYGALREMMQIRYGLSTEVVMPIAYSPTAIWILRPLEWASMLIDPALAWNILSLVVLAAVLLLTDVLRLHGLHLIGMSLLVSSAGTDALFLGQSSILGTALLLLLTLPAQTNRRSFVQGLALVLLSIKPTYFCLGAGFCACAGNLRPIFFALGPIALLAGAATIQLPAHAWSAWLHNIHFYSTGLDPHYLALGTQAVFRRTLTARTLFSEVVGYEQAWGVSRIIFFAAAGLWLAAGLALMQKTKTSCARASAWGQAGILSVLLLFSPYIGFYEETLGFVFLVLIARSIQTVGLDILGAALLLVLPAWQGPYPTLWLTLGKTIGTLWLLWRSSPFNFTAWMLTKRKAPAVIS